MWCLRKCGHDNNTKPGHVRNKVGHNNACIVVIVVVMAITVIAIVVILMFVVGAVLKAIWMCSVGVCYRTMILNSACRP